MPYCIHCGSPLEEGQVCTCPAAQADAAPTPGSQPEPTPQQPAPEPQANPVPQQPAPQQGQPTPPPAPPRDPSPVAVTFKNLLPFLKAYWRNPAAAAKSAADQNDLFMSGLLIIIQAVAAILAMASFITKINRAISPLFGYGLYGGVSGWLSILYGLLGTVLGVGLMILMLFGLSKLLKGSGTLKQSFILCGVHTLPVTVLLLLTFILGLLSAWLGVVLLLTILPVFVLPGLMTARQLCPEAESGKFYTLYIVGVFLVLVIFFLLFSLIAM